MGSSMAVPITMILLLTLVVAPTLLLAVESKEKRMYYSDI